MEKIWFADSASVAGCSFYPVFCMSLICGFAHFSCACLHFKSLLWKFWDVSWNEKRDFPPAWWIMHASNAAKVSCSFPVRATSDMFTKLFYMLTYRKIKTRKKDNVTCLSKRFSINISVQRTPFHKVQRLVISAGDLARWRLQHESPASDKLPFTALLPTVRS